MRQCDARGLAPPEIHPVAMYVCRDEVDDGVPTPMRELTRSNVVAHTGAPARHRTCSIYVDLQPGTYVVLCGAYMEGLEGPFSLDVITNTEVGQVEQIVPRQYDVQPQGKLARLAGKVGEALINKAEDAEKQLEALNTGDGAAKPKANSSSGGDDDDLV
jgi:hypothetical protein